MPRFITKKWIEVYDQSGKIHNINKQIRFKASMLQSDLCHYSGAYIVVERTITVKGRNDRYLKNWLLAFKKNASFISCISKINNALIENREDLDVIILMYNLIDYRKKYSKTSGNLWNCYRDEPNNSPIINYDSDPITNSASFKHKISIIGTPLDNDDDNDDPLAIFLELQMYHLWNN